MSFWKNRGIKNLIAGCNISTIDYDDNVSLIFFLTRCNFRCPFCHSASLVLEEDIVEIPIGDAAEIIKNHIRFIDGIVITGGEPMISPKTVNILSTKAKEYGLLVKLDTNGTLPYEVEKLCKAGLVDKIAMDIKTFRDEEEYKKVSGGMFSKIPEYINNTMKIVKKYQDIVLECRTTVVPGLVGTEEDIRKICEWIKPYADEYFIQNFRPEQTLDKRYEKIEPYNKKHLDRLYNVFREVLPDIKGGIRNA